MSDSLSDLMEAWSRKHYEEYKEFDRIPEADRLNPDRTICGLLYLQKLLKNPSSVSFCAEHDVVNLVGLDELTAVTESDVIYLKRCGILWGQQHESFYFFT